MTSALINIHLTDGLTAAEIIDLARLGRLDGMTVEQEIMEALRQHVRRHRRKLAQDTDPAEVAAAQPVFNRTP